MIDITDTNMKLAIKGLLSTYNPEEVVRTVITEYMKNSVENCQFLLKLIPEIADHSIHLLNREVARKSHAISMIMFENAIDWKGNEDVYFASMLPVCITHFPEGNAKKCSEAERRYFNLFCKLFKNRKAFSWERDKDWADSYGYTDYLRLVEKQINEEND